MCILYAFYFRHMCVFYVSIIIMFLELIRKYYLFSSLCAQKKGKEKEKENGMGFLLNHVKEGKKGRGVLCFLFPNPQTHPTHREEKKRRRRR